MFRMPMYSFFGRAGFGGDPCLLSSSFVCVPAVRVLIFGTGQNWRVQCCVQFGQDCRFRVIAAAAMLSFSVSIEAEGEVVTRDLNRRDLG